MAPRNTLGIAPANIHDPDPRASTSEDSTISPTQRNSFDVDDDLPGHTSTRNVLVSTVLWALDTGIRSRLGFRYSSTRDEESLDSPSQAHLMPLMFREVQTQRHQRSFGAKSRLCERGLYTIPVLALSVLGVIFLLQVIIGEPRTFWDADPINFLPEWGMARRPGSATVKYPSEATRDIIPIPCHSHNDYLRRVPLFDAIHFGCTGVEADVWLSDGELYVGHEKTAPTKNRTFESLYVKPLVELLHQMNLYSDHSNSTDHGAFDTTPNQSLVLLVDIKTDGRKTFPYVHSQLEALRSKNFLTYWDGDKLHPRAITVVGTGNTPFEMVVEDKNHRDIFFDAPLEALRGELQHSNLQGMSPSGGQGTTSSEETAVDQFDTSTSYYASTSFQHSVGSIRRGRLSNKQLGIIRQHISSAKERGLKARYWDTPVWPIHLRHYVWTTLVEEGVDVLNVDDLRGATVEDWKTRVRRLWF